MFDAKGFIEESVERLQKEMGKEKAIIALSGGVDSSTATALAGRAIKGNLVAVFVDTGFMRKDEPRLIENMFKNQGVDFRMIERKKEFLAAIKGISDPEEKRTIIGATFIKVFEEVAKKVGAKILVQGTIAPDWIETGGKIKSHHNVKLPSGTKLKVVEPLRELYKDEVRAVARELGLPSTISNRMPFPGPGLAVRVVGEVTKERLDIVKEADVIVKEEIKKASIEPWQAFAVILEGRATGVKGDSRDYGYIVAIRIVESLDAMTANAMEVDYSVLRRIADRIPREIKGVTRVVYDLTNKPPATIEFE